MEPENSLIILILLIEYEYDWMLFSPFPMIFYVYLPSESLTQPELHACRTDDKQILDSLASRPTFWTLAMPPAWHR